MHIVRWAKVWHEARPIRPEGTKTFCGVAIPAHAELHIVSMQKKPQGRICSRCFE